jgi:hypothetical protein
MTMWPWTCFSEKENFRQTNTSSICGLDNIEELMDNQARTLVGEQTTSGVIEWCAPENGLVVEKVSDKWH